MTQEKNLEDLAFGNDFFIATPRAQSVKEIIDKVNFIKIKNFSSLKDTDKRKKRQFRDGRRYL